MLQSPMNSVTLIDLGLMSYASALEQQLHWHDRVLSGHQPVILVVEHEPVLTLGKNSSRSHLLFSKDYYIEHGVQYFETDRGGEVTAHMPGQLVVYPIVDLSKKKLSIKEYITGLENAVIGTLDVFGITAAKDPDYPGVWVGSEKICAIGVRVKSRVSMHGLALNVRNELELFRKIVPCGITARGVTSMTTLLNRDILMNDVKRELFDRVSKLLK